MMKRLIAGAFIIVALSTSATTLSYANNTINKNPNQVKRIENRVNVRIRPKAEAGVRSKVEGRNYFFEVLEPERNIISTDKTMLLSFRASEGTDVRIEVYNNVSANDRQENYVLSYDPIDIKVGALQRGWASVDLKSGLNKILFTIKYKNEPGDSIERIINVMEVQEVKQLLQNVVNKSTLGIGKRP